MLKIIDNGLRITLLAVCIIADAALNSSRVMTLGFDTLTTYAWLAIAITCAMAPAIISSYADQRAVTIGLYSCLASFILSVWAVYSSIDHRAFDAQAISSSAAMYQDQLTAHNESAARQIDLCSRKPASTCNSIELEKQLNDQRQTIQNKLHEAQSTKPMTSFEQNMTIGILIGIALFLQIWGAELGRQIGQILKNSSAGTRSNSVLEPELELVPEPKKGSLTRNQNQPGSRLEPAPEPKSKKASTRTHARIPNEQEKQDLKSAYGALMNKGRR